MAKLPDNSRTTLHQLGLIRHPRQRGRTVAMSTIGDPCRRRLWLTLHWAGDVGAISARLNNLFSTGTRAEDFIVADLERVGITVTNRQEELWGFAKHAHGFTDGRVRNVPEAPKTEHLLEIKTHNDRLFKTLVKDGVKKAFPKHYAQCQRYMVATKLTRTLYVGYSKNTSEYYIERLDYDKSFAHDLLRKERDIITAEEAPERKFDASWFECKFCDYAGICHENAPLARNCRTCKYVDLADDGVWVCTSRTHSDKDEPIPIRVQKVGCYEYSPVEFRR